MSVIIPTMNRPRELAECVRTMIRQTRAPDELVIVDNAELDDAPVRRLAVEAGLRYVFLRISEPGIARSRNLGIDHATGDIITFLDDDCLLHSHYMAEVMRVFEADARGEIGGVSGMERADEGRPRGNRLWEALAVAFRITGTRRDEGRMLPNGFMTEMMHLEKTTDVDYLHGCFNSWRREVFDAYRFDEFFNGYGLGEDKEFSHRVSRSYRLVVTPRAKIVHLESPTGRADFMARGFQMPYNNYYIFKKLMPQTLRARLMFARAVAGMVAMNTACLALSPSVRRMRLLLGIFKAVGHLLYRRPFRYLADRSPLRVMYLTTTIEVGGIEEQLVALIRGMDRARFTPMVCCLKEPGTRGEMLRREGVPVFSDLRAGKANPIVLFRLAKLMRRERVDVVCTVGTGGDRMFWGRLGARLAGVPTIVSSLHSMGLPDHVEWPNRLIHGVNHAFIAVAGIHKRYLAEHEGVPPSRTHVIYNGVEPRRWADAAPDHRLARSLGISPHVPLAGIVACLRPEKNHELFLRAAARVVQRVPDAHFLVVGDGPRIEDLVGLTRSLGLTGRVHFAGRHDDVPPIMALLDVAVLSSKCEAFPMAVLEAMAAGKPVVSTDVGAVREAIDDGGAGFLVARDDVAGMADAIARLLADRPLARRLGRNAQRRVAEQFSCQRMIEGYEDLFLDLAARVFRRPSRTSARRPPTAPAQERRASNGPLPRRTPVAAACDAIPCCCGCGAAAVT